MRLDAAHGGHALQRVVVALWNDTGEVSVMP
jgi:hypothetical protein